MPLFNSLRNFEEDTEREYNKDRNIRDLYSIRYASIIGFLFNILLIFRDYFASGQMHEVLIIRGGMLLTFCYLLTGTFKNPFGIKHGHLSTQISVFVFLLLTFLLDYKVNMPLFYLPNALILISFVSNVSMGLSFLRAVLINVCALIGFYFYSFFISSHHLYHISQLLNVTMNFSLAMVVGFIFERESRRNFIQRKQLENANKELENTNAVKNKLLSLLSHDLKSPLDNLSGILTYQKDKIITEEEFGELSNKIKQNLEASSNLLSNITKWSVSQMDGFKPTFSAFPIKPLLEEVIKDLGSIPQEKNISIHLAAPKDLICTADQEMIKMGVRNIISNSIKFSDNNKNVWISADHFQHQVRIIVKDEGRGISESDLNKLFTFQIRSKAGTNNENGSGIGLQLTYDFIKLNGGRIEVQSAIGKGATFLLYLKNQQT